MSEGLKSRVKAARAAGGQPDGDRPAPVIDQQGNAVAVSRYNVISTELVRKESWYDKASPAGGPSGQLLIADAATALRSVDKLDECDVHSVLGAVMTCAQLGLRIGGALGHAYILPFWNSDRQRREATFVLGYKGLVKLANQSGRVRGLVARTVFEREVPAFRLAYRHDADELTHEPYLYGDAGAPVLYYARALLLGGGYQLTRPVHREAMRKHRAKYVKIKSGPWFDDRGVPGDGFEAMSHKTVLKQLGKVLPLSTECVWAIAADGGVRVDTSPDADVAQITEQPAGAEPVPGEQSDPAAEATAVDPDGWPTGAAPIRPGEATP